MEVASQLWPEHIYELVEDVMAEAFGMSDADACSIFCNAERKRGIDFSAVTPEMVADDIDEWRASHEQ
jgi:hypothetical protein